MDHSQTQRPEFSTITSGKEFVRWYWLKIELVEICKHMNLPYSGNKFELRDRIVYALDNEGKLLPKKKKRKPRSSFNWAKATLTPETLITDNVSFGPNFRKFMKSQIGKRFYCHSDFMDWVKSHPGKTLRDAVLKWEEMNMRTLDPEFKREIATHNMLAQYVRDFLEDNPNHTLKDALCCWNEKKLLPMPDGFVRYVSEDRSFLQTQQ